MEELKGFALMLVFCAAAGLVYYLLLPAGNVSDTAKGVLGALLLLCVLTPLFSFFRMELPSFSFEESAVTADGGEVLLAAAETQVRQLVEAVVREYTDLPFETELAMHITEDHSIDMEQVRITFPRDFGERAALTEALGEALGVPPDVAIREDVWNGGENSKKN